MQVCIRRYEIFFRKFLVCTESIILITKTKLFQALQTGKHKEVEKCFEKAQK